MSTEPTLTKQDHIDAGDGVERTVTEARSGVRRGISKILVISTVLAVGAIGGVWLLAAHPRTPATSAQAPASPPGGAPASAVSTSQNSPALQNAPASSNVLRTQAWDQAHLGPDGMKKCSAFRKVLQDSQEAQGRDNGTMSAAQRSRLSQELSEARTMPPAAVTPFKCGVPL
jgi:hypothetical protein